MRILFATDGAKQSNAAIDVFEKFALKNGDEIRVINVVDIALPVGMDIYGGYLPDTTELEKTAKESAAKLVAETADRIKRHFNDIDIFVTTDVLFGSPESRIVETAEEFKPDLVVVGSHGYSSWERLLLGSVSGAVVHHAPCSVLVIRTPKETNAE